jgi:hypothetical protein
MSNPLFDSHNKPKKLRQEIVVKTTDGSLFCGRIFLGLNERVLDVMNNTHHFLSIELESNQIIILAKHAISAIDTLEKTNGVTSNFDKTAYQSILYVNKDKKTNSTHTLKQENIHILRELNDTLSKEKITMDTNLLNDIKNVLDKIEDQQKFK